MITDLRDQILDINSKMSYNISLYQNREETNSSFKFLMKRVNKINELLALQNDNLNLLKINIKKFLNTNEYSTEKNIKKKILTINDEISDLTEKVNEKLKTMRVKISETKKENDKSLSDIRHVETIINIFQSKNIENLRIHSKLQIEFKSTSYQKTKNNILMRTGMKEQEVDYLLKNEPEKILNILETGEDVQDVKVDNYLQDMKEKLDNIKKIDKGVEKLLKMLQELHMIIREQNETVDSIEFNMDSVKDDLIVTEKDMDQSNKLMVSAQEKIWCAFIVMVFLSIFIINFFMGQIIG